jgi:hypothetical protein
VKETLKDLLALAFLLAFASWFGWQGCGERRGYWSGARGQVVAKRTQTSHRSQTHWVRLATAAGSREIAVGNGAMTGCRKGDRLVRAPRSLWVTCGGRSYLDWGGMVYAFLGLVFLVVALVFVAAKALTIRDVRNRRRAR